MSKEKYSKFSEAMESMDSKALLDELEQRALMASFGHLDPTTAEMLKIIKTEILKRLKSETESEPKQKKASLFDS